MSLCILGRAGFRGLLADAIGPFSFSVSGVDVLENALGSLGLTFAKPQSDEITRSYGVVTAGYDGGTDGAASEALLEPAGFTDSFIHAISQHRYWDRETDGLAGKVAF